MWILYVTILALASHEVFGADHFGSDATTDALDCETDRDCPDDAYCYRFGKNPLCITCFNCNIYFRQNKIRCARKVQECGDCLPGYISATVPSEIRWCKKDTGKVIIAEAQNKELDIDNSMWCIFSIFCFVALAGLALFCFVRGQEQNGEVRSEIRNQIDFENHCSSGPTVTRQQFRLHPPPYTAEDEGTRTFELNISEQSINEQKAVPFSLWDDISDQEGHHSNHCRSEANQPDEIGNDDDDNNNNNNNGATNATVRSVRTNGIEIHDETTSPSFWTPGGSYSDSAVNLTVISETQNRNEENAPPPNKRKKLAPESQTAITMTD